MADEATSIGKIQLDVEISKSSLAKEMEGLNKAFGNSFKSAFNGIGNQMNGFMKTTIGKMVGGFKQVGQEGANANKQVAQSVGDVSAKMENLVIQMESATNRAEMHRQKLLEVQAQYDRLNSAGLGDSDKGKKLRDQITIAEDKVNRYGAVSDRTRAKIDLLGQSMASLGASANQSSKGLTKADDGANKTSRSFKTLGDQADKSSGKVGAFSNTLTRSFMQVLKRVFIINLIYRAIRGLMNYMNSSLKTNKEFTNSLNQISTNLKVAFQPIYDYILPALNALMRTVATVTAYIAAAISALFGKSYKQSFGAAKGIESAKKAMDGYGKSAKKAKGTLAGFDEINQLDIADEEDSGGGGTGGYEMEMPDTSTIDLSGLDRFKELLQPTIDSLKNLGLALDPLKSFVSQGLQDFYNNFLVPVGKWTFGEGLPRFIDAITKGLMGISWQTINNSLNGLWLALTPFTINVGIGLLWLWENVLVPIGTWTMNEIVPRFLDILAEAINVLNIVIEILKPLGQWLLDNFLQPLAEWTGGVIVSVLVGLKLALEGIGDWISNNQKAVENMAIAVGSFMTAWVIVDLVTKIWGIVTALTTFITTGGLATLVTTGLAAAIAFLTSPVTIAIAVIGALIAAGVLLYKNWDEISTWLKEIWEGIQIKATEVFGNVKEFISTTITAISANIDKFSKSFKATWDTLWNGAKTVFKTVVESLTGIFKGVINNIIGIVNKFIDFWNKIELKVPEIKLPFGGSVGGFTIGVPKLANIPQLARGGIVDQPTLAMVGERGKEAVVPLENTAFVDTLASALGNAVMAALKIGNNNSNNSSNGDMILQLDGTTFARLIKSYLDSESQRTGNNIIIQPI